MGVLQNSREKSNEEPVSFVQEFGHARVTDKFPQNPSLGTWANTQRQSYKRYLKGASSSKMIEDRIQLLNKVGFEWECRHIQPWERSYEELVKFVEEFGHTRVPAKFPQNLPLGNWVRKQRSKYKKLQKEGSSSITENQIELLNKIGFEWKIYCSNSVESSTL
mmetsp:Transcript_27083/g.27455  ORF Transcript_27083/g.27455 Transcript_27083/m.27455 type:complete len:163 (-) Transcript_27083:1235-1723(-)